VRSIGIKRCVLCNAHVLPVGAQKLPPPALDLRQSRLAQATVSLILPIFFLCYRLARDSISGLQVSVTPLGWPFTTLMCRYLSTLISSSWLSLLTTVVIRCLMTWKQRPRLIHLSTSLDRAPGGTLSTRHGRCSVPHRMTSRMPSRRESKEKPKISRIACFVGRLRICWGQLLNTFTTHSGGMIALAITARRLPMSKPQRVPPRPCQYLAAAQVLADDRGHRNPRFLTQFSGHVKSPARTKWKHSRE